MTRDEQREVRWTLTELDPILDQLGRTVGFNLHPDQDGTTQSMLWDNWSYYTPCAARIVFEVSAILTYPTTLGPATPI